ncbi:hypothetical protein B0H10DRAFT_2091674 [Mycena sp. CBHHK59/15]|nr:hypothetical protein B0H10DRAFT_2091674 [Mycena sp. CBHHK59/15]
MDGDEDASQWVVPFTPHHLNSFSSSSMDNMATYSPAGQFFVSMAPSAPLDERPRNTTQSQSFTFHGIETPQSGVTPHTYNKRRRQNSQVTANDENIPPTPSGPSQKRARAKAWT